MAKGREKVIQMLRPFRRLLNILNQMLIQRPLPMDILLFLFLIQSMRLLYKSSPQLAMMFLSNTVFLHISPRRVAQTVCAVHVDVTAIEDCKERLSPPIAIKQHRVWLMPLTLLGMT